MKKVSVTQVSVQVFVVFIYVLIFGQAVFAQTDVTTSDRGFSPGKSYSISDIETIAMQSGNLMLNVPLSSLPAGRGGISAAVGLQYNSKLWDTLNTEIYDTGGPVATYDKNVLQKSDEGGWRYGYKYYLKVNPRRFGPEATTCNNPENAYLHKISLVMPDGSAHTLSIENGFNGGAMQEDVFTNIYPDGRSACDYQTAVNPGQTVTFFTTDNTFLRLEVTTDSDTIWENNTWTLFLPNGTRVIHNPTSAVSQRIQDTNDNYIDVIENSSDSNYSGRRTTYLLDQLGRKVVIDYNADNNEDWIRSKGFNGADIITRVKWKSIAVNKAYVSSEYTPSPSPVDNSNFPLDDSFWVVDRVYLPVQISGNLFYEFGYNVDGTSATDVGWGEVNRVTLPSGAFSEYDYRYDNVSGSSITANKVLANRVIEKSLTYNIQYDGTTSSTSETWLYQTTGTDYNNPASVSIVAPNGGVTTEYYNVTSQSYPANELYKSESPDGTVTEKYYQNNAPTSGAASAESVNRYTQYEFVSITDANGNLSKTAIKKYTYDKNGNVTLIDEYDYANYGDVPRSNGRPTGVPSGASLLRTTKTDYYYQTPEASQASYTDPNIYRFPSAPKLRGLAKASEIKNISGIVKARSEMVYDNSSIAPTKGNLTETKTWDSTKQQTLQNADSSGFRLDSNNSISTKTAYDGYGNPTLLTDAKGVETTITYGCIDGRVSCEDTPWLNNLYPTKTETASNFSGLKRTLTTIYDFYTGLTTSVTDVDINVTDATYYDDLGRVVKTAAAVGTALETWTQTDYNDQYRRVIVRSDIESKGDARKVSTQFYDQLGRVRLSKTLEDSATQDPTNETDGVKVQTRYKASSACAYDNTKTCSFKLTSNPYRASSSSNAVSEPAMGWTRLQTVNNSRHSEIETFSTSSSTNLPYPWGTNSNSTGKVKTDIDGERTLVNDQAGKKKISKTNALGQLTNVWEVLAASDAGTSVSVEFPIGGTNYHSYHTSYQYDTLGNLTQVRQPIGTSGGQTREFSYSSLSRLLSANNPESGTISYVYDDSGNLTSKIDARSVTTTYQYDALSRLTNRSYNDSITPTVIYTYDDPNIPNSKGKLTKVTTAGSSSTPFSVTEYQAFDKLGRILQSRQATDGTSPDPMTYIYNLSGVIVEQKYPSGRIVKNVLDNNGALSKVQSRKNASGVFWNYARNFTYTASGTVSSFELGNFLWESTVFNSRLQPTQIGLGKSKYAPNTTNPATDLLDLDYQYGDPLSNGSVDATKNNGNISKQTITVPAVGNVLGFSAVQIYTYDALNRIHDARENIDGNTTPQWKQTFVYDRFGNRTFDEANTTADLFRFPKECGVDPNKTMCATDKKIFNPSINTSNDNRLNTNDGYSFDNSGNTLRTPQNRKFTYDGENKQIKVETFNANGIVDGLLGEYWYDGEGKRVKKNSFENNQWITTIFIYDASGKLVEEYSSFAATQENAKASYLTNDHLGSPRITTDQNGQTISRRDFQPFGEEIATSQRTQQGLGYINDTVKQKFTSYERDSESELDFAQARYYSSKLGRFYSVDPENYGASEDDPQSWNAYAYSRNNPALYTDPTGLEYELCDADGKNCVTQDDDVVLGAQKKHRSRFQETERDGDYDSGEVLDDDGNVIGTYERTSIDPQYQLVYSTADASRRKTRTALIVGGVAVVGGVCIGTGTCAAVIGWGARVLRGAKIVSKLCFVEGTLILTESGLKPIEEISEGDKVLSYNEKTKQTEYKTVLQTMVREAEAGRILSVKVEGEAEALGVTGEHPFYVKVHAARSNLSSEEEEGQWIEAKDLRMGNEIRKANGSWAKVEWVTQASEGGLVYNFEVVDNHNYFVGQTNLLAHNNNNCFTTIGNGLKNIRQIATGRLRGFRRGNTTLSGGDQAARETFKQLTGRYPSGSFDRVVTGGKEIMYRAASNAKSGVPKLDIVDTAQKTLEKISFTP